MRPRERRDALADAVHAKALGTGLASVDLGRHLLAPVGRVYAAGDRDLGGRDREGRCRRGDRDSGQDLDADGGAGAAQ